jgi:hypothetical protein
VEAGFRSRLLAWILAALLLAPAAMAEEVDWKKGALQHLAPLIGTYRYEEVLGDAAVRAALAGLAGGHEPRIRANLVTHGAIDFVDGHLVLRGLAPHQGGLEEATVWVKIFDGSVRAALLHAGTMTLFARDKEYRYLPAALRAFLVPRESGALDRPLRGLVWLGRTP